jgi:hypothetical protein
MGGRRRKVVLVKIRNKVVGRRRMVERIKMEVIKGSDESKGDGEENKASYNKNEIPYS